MILNGGYSVSFQEIRGDILIAHDLMMNVCCLHDVDVSFASLACRIVGRPQKPLVSLNTTTGDFYKDLMVIEGTLDAMLHTSLLKSIFVAWQPLNYNSYCAKQVEAKHL